MAYRRPVPLSDRHVISKFSCGKPTLDDWLKDMAWYNQINQYTRTFVIADESGTVVAYHSLCAGMIHRHEAPRSIKGGQAPNEIPVALLARLAVDRHHQGRGLGPALLSNAARSVISASQQVAFRAIMVDAIDEDAASFYRKFGFRETRISATKLLLPTRDILASLEAATE